MTDIRYICLSDLHFGQNDSLLTNLSEDKTTIDVSKPSPVLTQLATGLRSLVQKNSPDAAKPTLILNGDVLEIALETMNQAAMGFERFIEQLLPATDPEPMFDRIVYIPGNHDHHFWEMAREAYFVKYITEEVSPSQSIAPPHHVTPIFMGLKSWTLRAYFLTRLIQRYEHLKSFNIDIAYPNFGLTDANRSKAVVFHHGHFVESLYHLMSNVGTMMFPDRPQPTQTWDVEMENFAWIDFFWSTMGRSGRIGPLVQKVYNSLGGGKGARHEIIGNLVKSVIDKIDPPGINAGWTLGVASVVNSIMDRALDHERAKSDGPISKEAFEGLTAYLQGPVLNQISMELAGQTPRVDFVFGHTHKPFEQKHQFEGYAGDVSLYNTGGWVVETTEPFPDHGASAVLINEALETVQLQLYKEDDPAVGVVAPTGDMLSPFGQSVQERIDGDTIWRDFARTVSAEVAVHADFLRARRG